jgi:hypothetical protein
LEEEEASELLRVRGDPPAVTVDRVDVEEELLAAFKSYDVDAGA